MSLLSNNNNNREFIINAAVPACRNCKFLKPASVFDLNYNFEKCTKFGIKDMVIGNIVYDYADSCRNQDDKCGKKGIFFEPKEKSVYNILQ